MVAPSLVKHGGITLKSYQRLHFKMVVTGVESLDYRIEDKPAFSVAGSSIELFGDMADMTEPINQFWSILESSGKMAVLAIVPFKNGCQHRGMNMRMGQIYKSG